MEELTFGFTLAVIGMGATFVTLWFIGLLTNILKRILPLRKEG